MGYSWVVLTTFVVVSSDEAANFIAYELDADILTLQRRADKYMYILFQRVIHFSQGKSINNTSTHHLPI